MIFIFERKDYGTQSYQTFFPFFPIFSTRLTPGQLKM